MTRKLYWSGYIMGCEDAHAGYIVRFVQLSERWKLTEWEIGYINGYKGAQYDTASR